MAAVQVCYEGDGCLDDGPNPIKRGIPPRGNFEASGGMAPQIGRLKLLDIDLYLLADFCIAGPES